MLDKWHAKTTLLDPNTLARYGACDYYDAMVGSLATQGHVWDSKVNAQESMTQNIEDKRQQISGVSTEEEMVSLLSFQHAYNAASRYINAIDEMLQKTSTTYAPWHILESVDKKYARIKALQIVVDTLEKALD